MSESDGSMRTIKVGIWGLGRAGQGMHVDEIAKFPTLFEVVAGSDIAKDRLAAFKGKSPDSRLYRRPAEFLKDPGVELVSIATRSPDHTAHAIKALADGKYVLLEKPIALSYAEARTLKKAAEKYPGKLFLRHNRRFEAPFCKIREIMASGVLGEVYEVKLHRHGYQRRNDWQTIMGCGGGQLNNWGPHIIDHALRFLESPVANIWSDLKRIAAVGDAEDHLKIVLTGENGRIVDLEISGGVAIAQPEYVVFGNRGTLVCQGSAITMKYIDPKQKLLKCAAYADNPPLNGVFGNSEVLRWVEKNVQVVPQSEGDDTQTIWPALYHAIRRNKPFPITIDEALEVVKVADIARRFSEFSYPRNVSSERTLKAKRQRGLR
jgi:scyllo-inositol 2-dehydrogenase (NADP+)